MPTHSASLSSFRLGQRRSAVNSPLPYDASRHLESAKVPVSANRADLVTDRLVSVREIALWFGLGRTAAYELTHRDGFPAPVVISPRCYRWPAGEVAEFAAGLRKEQRAGRHTTATQQRARSTVQTSGTSRRITGTVRAARASGRPVP
jgi:predicted DNA-binding transcriptional regulator AlpA